MGSSDLFKGLPAPKDFTLDFPAEVSPEELLAEWEAAMSRISGIVHARFEAIDQGEVEAPMGTEQEGVERTAKFLSLISFSVALQIYSSNLLTDLDHLLVPKEANDN